MGSLFVIRLTLLVALSITSLKVVYAQNDDYYETAFNLNGSELKAALHKIIDGHIQYPYTSSSTDTWDILKNANRDQNNKENVILLYSSKSVNAEQEYNNGNGWTREHVWAKSRGDFGTAIGEGTDIHNLAPCANSVNSTRNNRNFDDCVNCTPIDLDGNVIESKYDDLDWTFEPRDAVKGDVARILFYMVIRYEGHNGDLDLELQENYLARDDKSPFHARLSTLLKWHKLDPVDSFEVNRNNVIYTYQKNRNPFIDYPDLVDFLWGDKVNVKWSPALGLKEIGEMAIYPNPTNGLLRIDFEYDEVTLINYHSELILTTMDSKQMNLSHYPKGMYILRIKGGKFDGQNVRLILN